MDVKLHTHRHRLSRVKQQFQKEINDNRERIESITHKPTEHFCYPGGFCLPEYVAWMAGMNISSATTCALGIATRVTPPLLLPRLVDSSNLGDMEFRTWVSGLASFLPKWRAVMKEERSFLEPEAETLGVQARV